MKVQLDGKFYDCDDKWSFKNFSNRPVPDLPDGIVVYSTAFYHEQDAAPFPEKMTGVTFVKCNLDNVTVPRGNTIIQCSQKRFRCQKDGCDWEIDADDRPVKLACGGKPFIKFGVTPPTPVEIPETKVKEPVEYLRVRLAEKQLAESGGAK